MTFIHIIMASQYLNNNHVTYYVITQVYVRLCHAVCTPNNVVRIAMYFRSYFMDKCKYIHFWKDQTFLKPKTNVAI